MLLNHFRNQCWLGVNRNKFHWFVIKIQFSIEENAIEHGGHFVRVSTSYHIQAETKRTPFGRRHFKCIFLNENVCFTIEISLKFVPKGSVNSIPALAQIMAWRRSGDKPLSEPMVVSLLKHMCVTRLQWVKDPSVSHSVLIDRDSNPCPSPVPSLQATVAY